MEGNEFKIRARRPSKRVTFGLLSVYALLVPVYFAVGFQPGFSGKVSAYAREVQSASGLLEIPSISLSAPVSRVELAGRKLSVPNYIVGKYQSYENKVLLMGHSSTVFADLSKIQAGNEISYDGQVFEVVSKEVREKSEISMKEILRDEEKLTLTLMTCFGEHISGQDYSHRLIVNAVVRGE